MDQQSQQLGLAGKAALRKAYMKPAILETTPLEAVANVCQQGDPTPGKQAVGVGNCLQASS